MLGQLAPCPTCAHKLAKGQSAINAIDKKRVAETLSERFIDSPVSQCSCDTTLVQGQRKFSQLQTQAKRRGAILVGPRSIGLAANNLKFSAEILDARE